MSSIHYRFRSSAEFDQISFDGPSITVSDLRELIMLQKKITKLPGHTLEITNAQTKEVYKLDSDMVHKNASVTVKRVPVQRLDAVTAQTSGLSKEEEELTEIAFAKLSKTADLVNAKASEDDKIKAMMKQSTEDFNPSQYRRTAPPNYACYRCNGKGHYVKDCPTQGDPRYNNTQYAPRAPSGIPRQYYMFRMKQEEELIKNLRSMQSEESRYSPICRSDVVDHTKVPSDLQCPMCKKLFTDVVVTPCCGDSFCDECIRNYLVDNELVCICGETTSPDNLIANKSLRISVSNFRNKKKVEMKSVPPSPVSAPSVPFSMVSGPVISAPLLVGSASGPLMNSNEAMNTPQIVEPAVSQIPQQPEFHSESSQSESISNGLAGSVDSSQDSDTAMTNSPKVPVETVDGNQTPANINSPVVSQQLVPPPVSQVVTSLPVSQPAIMGGSIASQVLPYPSSAAGPAIYSNVQPSMRARLIIPSQQPHMVPGGVVGPYGIPLPAGARIVKRLVPVPVGPRLSPSQMHLAQQHALATGGGVNPHFVESLRMRPELRKPNDKHSNEVDSPMPMTEMEFYQWQQTFKKRTGGRRRHRSSSHDGARERFRSRSRSRSWSRSRSPAVEKKRRHRRKDEDETVSPIRSKKKLDSNDDSSQERQRKKEKVKKRHRDLSQEIGKNESNKPRSHVEKKSKSRELPEHIKREIDEFEFDDEMAFDKALRKLRKGTKFKNAVDDVDISSEEELPFSQSATNVRSRSSSFSKLSRSSFSPPNSPDRKKADVHSKVDRVCQSGHSGDEGVPSSIDTNRRERTDSLRFSDNENDRILDNSFEMDPDGKLSKGKKSIDDVTTKTIVSTTENNREKTNEVKPKKKTKIIKKKVIRVIKVARKKQKSTSSTVDLPVELSKTHPEQPISQTHVSMETSDNIMLPAVENEIKPISENNDSIIEVKPDGGNDSVIEIPQNISETEENELSSTITSTDPSQPLPENSRWEVSRKPLSSSISVNHKSSSSASARSVSPVKKIKNIPVDGSEMIDSDCKGDKKKVSRKEHSKLGEKNSAVRVKGASSKEKIKLMHFDKSKIISEEVRSKKEAEKRALIENAKRAAMEKSIVDGKEIGFEEDERRRKREKYLLLKQRKAKERALAERQRLKKLESEGSIGKLKGKLKHNESDNGEDHTEVIAEDDSLFDDKRNNHGFIRPREAKLKTISEITKKRLKQSDGEPKKYEFEDEGSDVLKSKVTSIKTVIGAGEKRRVIKTSISEERELNSISSDDYHVRRVVKIDDRKKSLVSKVEKLVSPTDKTVLIRVDHEKRRHRDEESERRRRDKSLEREEAEKERFERRIRLREEENLRREMKDKIRLREIEERQLREKEELQKLKILEKEKLESLERERQALKEKEKLERKLKRERYLREEMVREKEENDKKKEVGEKRRHDKRKVILHNDGNSDEHRVSKRSKRDKNKQGYVIQILSSDKSDSESDSSIDGDREKKKKKKSKRKREKKRRKKKSEEPKLEEERDSEESSDNERRKKKRRKEESDMTSDDEEEDRKKKKRRKHKRKHKKHHKVKKMKKRSKKKKAKKEKSESESDEKLIEGSGDDSVDESTAESFKGAKSSTSSGEESVISSSTEKKVVTEELVSRTEEHELGSHAHEKSEELRTELDGPKRIKSDTPRSDIDIPLKVKSDTVKNDLDARNVKSDVCRFGHDTQTKERSRRSKTPRLDHDPRRKEKSQTPLSERDNRSKEKSQTPHSEHDNRSKEKSQTPHSEHDNRSKEKSQTPHSERDNRSKEKSETPRTENDYRKKERHSKNNYEHQTLIKERSKLSHEVEHVSKTLNELENDKLETLSVKDPREERVGSTSPSKDISKINDSTLDEDLELDYNEDLVDLDDDVLYGDLDFADDEQRNPDNDDLEENCKNISDDFEEGEILDGELFSAPHIKAKLSECDDEASLESKNLKCNEIIDNIVVNEPNEKDIENAVDDAISELSLDIELNSESPHKIGRTRNTKRTTSNSSNRVLRPKKR